MRHLIDKISNIFQKSLVRDSLWMILSQGSSVLIQAVYFIIVARVLGSDDYGTFIGTTALVAAVFPFVGLGSSDIFIKHVARDPTLFRGYWGTTLLTSFLFVFGLIPITLLIANIFFPTNISLLLVLLVLLADLLGLKMWELATAAFIAVDQVRLAAQAKILYSIGKLIAALVLLVFFNDSNVIVWGLLYCIGSILPALISVLRVNRSFGHPIFDLKKYRPEFSEGFFFSIAASAETVNAQIDKTMLVSLASVEVAGIYGAGYRFIDVGYTIIFAVMSATYTRFLRHGASGIKDGLKFARQLVPVATGYGIISAIALIAAAPFVSTVLGVDYAESANVLRWLAPIHLIAALQFIAADTLTGAGLQKLRSGLQVTSAALNFGLNLYLIPQFSWYGAIWATLVSESFKLITLWALVFFYKNKEELHTQNL
ncbi:MAG: oligosaccharide flippase family protein [Cyanobacteria bacterium P01_H01_bin.21]